MPSKIYLVNLLKAASLRVMSICKKSRGTYFAIVQNVLLKIKKLVPLEDKLSIYLST
jgi:hypothetical protein